MRLAAEGVGERSVWRWLEVASRPGPLIASPARRRDRDLYCEHRAKGRRRLERLRRPARTPSLDTWSGQGDPAGASARQLSRFLPNARPEDRPRHPT